MARLQDKVALMTGGERGTEVRAPARRGRSRPTVTRRRIP